MQRMKSSDWIAAEFLIIIKLRSKDLEFPA